MRQPDGGGGPLAGHAAASLPCVRRPAEPAAPAAVADPGPHQRLLRPHPDEREASQRSVEEDFHLLDRIAEEDPFPYSDRVHLNFLELFDDTRITEVLQALVPQHRVAAILAYVYGFTAREIREMTGRPLGTAAARGIRVESLQFALEGGLDLRSKLTRRARRSWPSATTSRKPRRCWTSSATRCRFRCRWWTEAGGGCLSPLLRSVNNSQRAEPGGPPDPGFSRCSSGKAGNPNLVP